MEISHIEAVSLKETISINIDYEGEIYRFTAIVFESPTFKFVTDIHYLDKYEKKLKNSDKKKIRNFIHEYFKTE